MSITASLSVPPTDRAAAVPAPVARALERLPQHLVVLVPLVMMPLAGTANHGLRLTLAVLLLLAVDAWLAAATGGTGPRRRALAVLVATGGLWLAAATLLGAGPMLGLGLVLLVSGIELRAATAAWPLRLALAALATALVLDLALVALALERGILWLALGAAIGTACAAARLLDAPLPDGGALRRAAAAGHEPARARLEAALVTALVLVLAVYGALLAHEPALVAAAAAGGYLTVPPLALAVLRLALLALDRERPRGIDPLALGLLAVWALSAASLLGQA